MHWFGIIGCVLSLAAIGWHISNLLVGRRQLRLQEAEREFGAVLQAAHSECTAGFARAFSGLPVPAAVAAAALIQHPRFRSLDPAEMRAIEFLCHSLDELSKEGAWEFSELSGSNAESRVRRYLDLRHRLKVFSGVLVRRNLTHESPVPELSERLKHEAKRALQEAGTTNAMELFNQL